MQGDQSSEQDSPVHSSGTVLRPGSTVDTPPEEEWLCLEDSTQVEEEQALYHVGIKVSFVCLFVCLFVGVRGFSIV